MDSDMSFFLRSPSRDDAEEYKNEDEDEDEKPDDGGTGFNEFLLDQEDFTRDVEYKATSTQISGSIEPPKMIPRSRTTRSNESPDDGELEILGIQETEKDKRNLALKSTPYVRSRTIGSKPPLKIRKTGTQPYTSKFSLFPKTDKSIEPLLTAISNLQTEKQHLQSELNTYVKKYEFASSELNSSITSLHDLKTKMESSRNLQTKIRNDLQKLAELRAGYEDQIRHLKSEKLGMQNSVTELKNKVGFLESSNQQIAGKLRSISENANSRENRKWSC